VDVVDRINGIVAMAPGKHLVAGLSLGGNYATYASTALAVDGSALYDRALIMAPFMGLPGIDLVLGPTNLLGFGEVSLYWGEDCQKERQNGRGGYCSMALSHMKAARDFGRAASKLVAQNMPNNLIVQLVLVQGDGSVDNSAIEKLRKLYAASSVTVDACLIDAVINETSYHSLISTWNNVGVDKYWIADSICKFVDFLAEGAMIPASTSDLGDLGLPFCTPRCTPSTCSFDCQYQSFMACPH